MARDIQISAGAYVSPLVKKLEMSKFIKTYSTPGAAALPRERAEKVPTARSELAEASPN